MKQSYISAVHPTADYELLDSGEDEKLERFGTFILSRPDPQALWRKRLSPADWKKAEGAFTRDADGGDWNLKQTLPPKWQIDFGGLKFWIKPTSFKHVGIFPEQAANWDWMRRKIEQFKGVEVLNLFGYTGGASLACAQAGAKVVHIDGSKTAIAWAREDAEISGLADKPIRWILDDARAFVRREIKRERKYHGIIMDPPAFGHGPDNELWKIEEHFLPLVEECMKILADQPLFFLINGYSAGYSALAYENMLLPLVEKYRGEIEIGELAIAEGNAQKGKEGRMEDKEAIEKNRLLPCGIFARWSSGK